MSSFFCLSSLFWPEHLGAICKHPKLQVLFNLGMVSPSLPVAITAQIFMGTTFVYSCKWSTDMNLYYSLGDSQAQRHSPGGVSSNIASNGKSRRNRGPLIGKSLISRVHFPASHVWVPEGSDAFLLDVVDGCTTIGYTLHVSPADCHISWWESHWKSIICDIIGFSDRVCFLWFPWTIHGFPDFPIGLGLIFCVISAMTHH